VNFDIYGVQKKILGTSGMSAGRSDALTRIHGVTLGAFSLFNLTAAHSGNTSTQRTATRITAIHSAAKFGMGAAQLMSKSHKRVGDKDNIIALTIANGLSAAFMGWRGFMKQRRAF
jgi:hypothetical protein